MQRRRRFIRDSCVLALLGVAAYGCTGPSDPPRPSPSPIVTPAASVLAYCHSVCHSIRHAVADAG